MGGGVQAVAQLVEAVPYKPESCGSLGIFHLRNPSDRIMALGSTQPLTEVSTRVFSWGVKAAGT
jgi:hypothetical protein